MNDPRDLSGVWYGSWTGDSSGVNSNRFIALLEEQGGTLGGMITEVEAGAALLRSFVSGGRSGNDIRFIKQYDGEGEVAHAVGYIGTVNDAGTEVTGRWSFASFAGAFVMERERFSTDELEEAEEAELPIWIPMVTRSGE